MMNKLFILVLVIFMVSTVTAENVTNDTQELGIIDDFTNDTFNATYGIKDTLDDVSNSTQSFVDDIKPIIPYEVWMALAIVLFVTSWMASNSMTGQNIIWRMGKWIGIALLIAFFLMAQ